MRRELVEEVLSATSEELFEDVTYTPAGGASQLVLRAIAGVKVAAERFDMMSQPLRDLTHTTWALKAKFPGISGGALINDGAATYRVLDVQPVGDGRYEIEISLKAI